jgi:hypothetical protein
MVHMPYNISKKELVNIILNSLEKMFSFYFIIRLGLTNVFIVPEGSAITLDYRTDRVRVFIDKKGVVTQTPSIG